MLVASYTYDIAGRVMEVSGHVSEKRLDLDVGRFGWKLGSV